MGKVARAPGASTADLTSAPGETPDWMKGYKSITPAGLNSETLREHAEKYRDKLQEAKDVDERLTEINKEISTLRFTTLPELFEKARLPGIDVAPSDNSPGYSFKLEDYYKANISAEWPQAQREAGFNTVRKLGGEYLIKNEISILVGKGEGNDELAQRILKGVKNFIEKWNKERRANGLPDADVVIDEANSKIPWNTLTAWLREKVEIGEEPTREELESIGGKISKQVVPKEIKVVTKPPRR